MCQPARSMLCLADINLCYDMRLTLVMSACVVIFSPFHGTHRSLLSLKTPASVNSHRRLWPGGSLPIVLWSHPSLIHWNMLIKTLLAKNTLLTCFMACQYPVVFCISMCVCIPVCCMLLAANLLVRSSHWCWMVLSLYRIFGFNFSYVLLAFFHIIMLYILLLVNEIPKILHKILHDLNSITVLFGVRSS